MLNHFKYSINMLYRCVVHYDNAMRIGVIKGREVREKILSYTHVECINIHCFTLNVTVKNSRKMLMKAIAFRHFLLTRSLCYVAGLPCKLYV